MPVTFIYVCDHIPFCLLIGNKENSGITEGGTCFNVVSNSVGAPQT